MKNRKTGTHSSADTSLVQCSLIEATSSQKVCATSIWSGDKGGGQLSASFTELEIKLKIFK